MKTLDDALSVAGQIEAGKYRLPGAFGSGSVVYLSGGAGQHGNEVEIRGTLLTSELRRIADQLDPQPDSSPVIPEGWALVPKELTRDQIDKGVMVVVSAGKGGKSISVQMQLAFEEMIDNAPPAPLRTEAAVRAEARREALAEAQRRAAMEGYEAFCRAIGMEPDCYDAIAHQVNARVERARREALEEAAKTVAARLYPTNPRHDWTDYARCNAEASDAAVEAIRALIEKGPQA